MSSAAPRPVDVTLYRACLALCPPAFRREFGEEMLSDFAAARDEALHEGRPALWRLRLVMAVDLGLTLTTQWMRTGWPLIAVVSLIAALTLAAALATIAQRATFVIPPDVAQSEAMEVLLLATISVYLIATTIALTLWAARPVRRRRR